MTPPAKQPAKCYSYLRFSTPEQRLGSSAARQQEAAARYAAEHKLVLDDELRMSDEGRSGFKGHNLRSEAALGQFKQLIEEGAIPRGSVLLVERMDRLTREAPMNALRLVEDILRAGVDVVTMATGRRWTAKDMRGFDIISLAVDLLQGFMESEKKAERLSAAWHLKREARLASKKPLTSLGPAWLDCDSVNVKAGADADAARFTPNRDRTAMVRRIVQMALDGARPKLIAKTLNREGAPLITKRPDSTRWHHTYIDRVLHSRALIGEATFTRTVTDEHTGARRKETVRTVADYYPRVLDTETWERLQEALANPASQRGRHASRPLQHILSGLATCPVCGGLMTRVTKHEGRAARLVCIKGKNGAGCTYRSVNAEVIEAALLKELPRLMAEAPPSDPQLEVLARGAEIHHQELIDRAEKLAELIASKPSARLQTQLERLEAQIAKARDALDRAQRDALDGQSKVVASRCERVLKILRARKLDRGALNVALKEVFRCAVVNYDAGALVLTYRHDGDVMVTFGWPKVE